jgi:hypothetical protein
MRDKGKRRLSWAAVGLGVLALLIMPKVFVYFYATGLKAKLTDPIWNAPSEQKSIEAFAHWAAGYWQVAKHKDIWNRLRALPKPFKPQKEAISFLSGEGQCTEFVAAARWVFGDRLKIVRHDIMFPAAGHSAISVQLSDGRWVFIDPFLGWMFKDRDRLLGLLELREFLAAGRPLEDFAVQLKPDAVTGFYESLPQAFDAKEFETMDVRLTLPLKGRNTWSLGELDGDWRDTQRAGQEDELTSHFFYVGRRYSANFQFRYLLPEDGREYELVFHLTEVPSPAALPYFSISPTIEGKTLRFRLTPEHPTLVMDASGSTKRRWIGIDRLDVTAR